jgi:hypothetical protein
MRLEGKMGNLEVEYLGIKPPVQVLEDYSRTTHSTL